MKTRRVVVTAAAGIAALAVILASQATATPAKRSADPTTWLNDRGVIDPSRVPDLLPIAVPDAVWSGGIGYVEARALHPFAPGYQADFDGPFPVFEQEDRGRVIAWYFKSLDEPVPVGVRPGR